MLRNRRIVSLTDDKPWWLAGGIPRQNCVAAYKPIGAAGIIASYTNLANPGLYTVYPGTFGPGFLSQTGWVFGGSYTAGTNLYTSAGMSWIIRIYGALITDAWRCAFGGQKGTSPQDGMCFYNSTATAKHLYKNGTTALQPSGNVATGVFAATPTAAYKDGVFDGNIDNSMSTASEIWIGCNNSGGSKVDTFNGHIQALAFYNIELTETQIMALTFAMNAL